MTDNSWGQKSVKKKRIDLQKYTNKITKALAGGVLLTTKADDIVNTMTIGWGTLGICWSKPVFIVFVRENRFTREQIDKNPEFTINIPIGEVDPRIMEICGSTSGRDTDKISSAGLTLVEPEMISVPGIKELPLTLECKIIYRQMQDLSMLQKGIKNDFYPDDVDGRNMGSNKDAHVMYFGEIVDAYIIRSNVSIEKMKKPKRMNASIINADKYSDAKQIYGKSEQWLNYAGRITKNPFIKKCLYEEYKNCQWCGKPLGPNSFVVHHMTYMRECVTDKTTRFPSPTEKRPDRTVKGPDCETCFHKTPKEFNECISHVVPVCRYCNRLIALQDNE